MIYTFEKSELGFIFTTNDFILDQKIQDESLECYLANKYEYLYQLAFIKEENIKEKSAKYLYNISLTFKEKILNSPEIEFLRENIELTYSDDEIRKLLDYVPFVVGYELINEEWIIHLLNELKNVFSSEIKEYKGTVNSYLFDKDKTVKIPEKIYFHLVENKEDLEYPFAFLATYVTNINGKIKHKPLSYSLYEYRNDTKRALTLLSTLNKAKEVSKFVNDLMCNDHNDIMHPIKLKADEAYLFLTEVKKLEEVGIYSRIPNWWRNRTRSSIKMSVKIGEKENSILGFDSLLSLNPYLSIDGVKLTKKEIKEILELSDGLALIKGKWVEIDHEKLEQLLHKLDENDTNISLLNALRMSMEENEDDMDSIYVSQGKWIKNLLDELKNANKIQNEIVPQTLNATLRPYQEKGYSWLRLLDRLSIGGCIADDMGLGKTIQVLTFLESKRIENNKNYNLLVVPASLLGNWENEILRFTPLLDYKIVHNNVLPKNIPFLMITTYSMLSRIKGLNEIKFDIVILDEAQAIKNPNTKQTKLSKSLNARIKFSMTGTPIENDLSNLWSIFDYQDKGLLGSEKEFKQFCSDIDLKPYKYQKLKNMISPFLLRRVKTDKSIIKDLPEKIEKIDYVELSKKQVVHYNEVLKDLENKLFDSDGIQRKGLILSTILKLKQICNHPNQYLGLCNDYFEMEDSGKFVMLKEICEAIYQKRERVLIFTQFKEIIEPLNSFLFEVFKTKGLVLHGSIHVNKRKEIVEQFQSDEYIPYMIISIKAGGTGLNLTKANHVIHFDRWWNPAVENQATDRAFRIGQKRNVVVHKFISRNTVEEKIDELINSKLKLVSDVIGDTSEKWITEMNNEEIMNLLKLEG